MKLQRFFVGEKLAIAENFISTNSDLIHQLKNVFRKRVGDEIVLLDNSGWQFFAKITRLDKKGLECVIERGERAKNVTKQKMILCQSLIKKDNFEFILQKATELGVSKIIPIMSERSEKKGINKERMEKILQEASEQSERGVLPELLPVMSLQEAIDWVAEKGIKAIAFHTGEEKVDWQKQIYAEDTMAVFVGPEGGYGELDLAIFRERQILLYSLGEQVLRAETAAIAVCAKVLLS